jgi:transaldolase
VKLFLDSASLTDIDECLARGILKGVTTNPSLLAKQPKTDFVGHIRKIADLFRSHQQILPLSVEVFARHAKDMRAQALELVDAIGYENVNIKIPMGWDEMGVIHQLVRDGVRVNCTCLFTEAQCIIAAEAGATYVSIFFARLRDVQGDPLAVITNTRQVLDQAGSPAEIIVGSIRSDRDIVDSHIAGAHIVTAGAEYFKKMTQHPQTTKSIDGFLSDFEKWLA